MQTYGEKLSIIELILNAMKTSCFVRSFRYQFQLEILYAYRAIQGTAYSQAYAAWRNAHVRMSKQPSFTRKRLLIQDTGQIYLDLFF